MYNSPLWRPPLAPAHTRGSVGLSYLGLQLELNSTMYQAAEEGEGGRDVGEAGGLSEGRPNSQNSTETPLNPAK